jgi:hypothetical protein
MGLWTETAHEAVKFTSKETAEAFMASNYIRLCRATEHVFLNRADRLHARNFDLNREIVELRAKAQALQEQLAERTHKARLDAYPQKCPITQRPFFMEIEHPDRGLVPTYGGPFDSYTIPEIEGGPGKPWHEYDFHCERYDHDAGGWVEGGEAINVRLIHEGVLYGQEDRAERAEAALAAALEREKAGRKDGCVPIPAKVLLAIRDEIAKGDTEEAFHLLYRAVPWKDPYKPWAEWEELAALSKESK